jgi:hypothetical protein
MAMSNTEKLARGYRYSGEVPMSPWNAQLEMAGIPTAGNPTHLGDGFVAVAPRMPPRRRISIEEFEADMRASRGR